MAGRFIFSRVYPYIITMLEFLAPRLRNALRTVNSNLLYELRIRTDKPLRINLGGEFCYLGENGVCERAEFAIVPLSLIHI